MCNEWQVKLGIAQLKIFLKFKEPTVALQNIIIIVMQWITISWESIKLSEN